MKGYLFLIDNVKYYLSGELTRKGAKTFTWLCALAMLCALLPGIAHAAKWQAEFTSLSGTGPGGFTSPYTSPDGGGSGNMSVLYQDSPAFKLANAGEQQYSTLFCWGHLKPWEVWYCSQHVG
jgi:hypothetical protein